MLKKARRGLMESFQGAYQKYSFLHLIGDPRKTQSLGALAEKFHAKSVAEGHQPKGVLRDFVDFFTRESQGEVLLIRPEGK